MDFVSNSVALQLAVAIAMTPNSINEFVIDVTASNGTEAATWRDLRSTFLTGSSGFSTLVGPQTGEVGPTGFTSGATGWVINASQAGSLPATFVVQVGGVSTARWHIKVRGTSRPF